MQEHFACLLGNNVYCFGIVDESTSKQYNLLYGEEHNSIGANNIASMVYYYLTNITSSEIVFQNI